MDALAVVSVDIACVEPVFEDVVASEPVVLVVDAASVVCGVVDDCCDAGEVATVEVISLVPVAELPVDVDDDVVDVVVVA